MVLKIRGFTTKEINHIEKSAIHDMDYDEYL